MALSRLVPAVGTVATVLSLLNGGCSSGSDNAPATNAPAQDKGIDPGAGTGTASPVPGQGTEVNPYGVAYPTKNLGYQARAGNRPGSIMRNYKFLGYRDGDPSKGTTVISLADYFDPQMKANKVIHFSAGALWCPPCNEEATALVPEIAKLKTKKVTVIQAIIEGNTRGTGSTLVDLTDWQERHKVNFTIFLDPKQGNLGQFFEAAAIPWNAYLDARSMEVLASGVGYTPDQAAIYDSWSKWIDENPAQAVK
jgi:thiol-disulfide isomerase/thioredoxin